jgi:hypothetical protein
VHAKVALRFDYGRYSHVIGAIEAGVNIEYYFTEVKQLAYEDPIVILLPRDITYVEPKTSFSGPISASFLVKESNVICRRNKLTHQL